MSAPEKSKASSSCSYSAMPRAKVYRLNDDGRNWDDQGTGRVAVDFIEGFDELWLIVIDENNNETLILHRISADDTFQKKEDTCIGWIYPAYSTEAALSFQEARGCSFIWDSICYVQRTLLYGTLSDETSDSVSTDSEVDELPAVELSNLDLILQIVVESENEDRMRLIELLSKDKEFFRKLMDLFKLCEYLGNIDSLHMIFKIVRGIVLLNSVEIFETICSEELIMDIIGSLEYDPEVPHAHQFRNFLKERVVFKEAIRIKSPVVLSKIHQTYRLGYLKDVVLARILDVTMVGELNFIINANNALIVSFLMEDSTFLQELFTRLRSPSTPDDSKKDLVYFLHEFCSLGKSLQMVLQVRFFRDLMNEGIFDIVAGVLQSSDKKLVLTGTEIILVFVNQDPNLLRTHVVEQRGSPLFGLLVKGLVTDFGDLMESQFLIILCSLLNTDKLSRLQRDTILDIFYEEHLGQLIDIITASCPIEGAGRRLEDRNGAKPEILSNICELLCFCALNHPFRIKSNFLLNNMVDKVVLLAQRTENRLVASAVRFIRTLLLYPGYRLIKHFVVNNTLKPIIDAFVANGTRYNLLNSAVLDLFEYIGKEDCKLLVRYIIDSFGNQLSRFESFRTIQVLKDKYQQFLNAESSPENEEEDNSSGERYTIFLISQLASGMANTPEKCGPVDDDNEENNDDDNDEDYSPPQREQPDTTDGDIDRMQVLRHERAPQVEPETVKKQRLDREHESNDGVLTPLRTTLTQAVLPGETTTNAAETRPCTSSSVEENPATSSNSGDSSSRQ